MKCAPILLIGFSRPDFMASQIDAIRKAKPQKVYVAVDGPRTGRKDDAINCQLVRRCIEKIDWLCEIKTLFQERNLGCKYGPVAAINWFFENEESGIILEDDCRPSIDFLRFASEMLEKYADDMRVGAINGFNYFNLQTSTVDDYHFSSHMDVWGWASWRRVWRHYDVELASIDALKVIDNSSLTLYSKRVFKKFVLDLKKGFSTWDVQLFILILSKKWLCIVPKERLVINAGFADNRATHTGGYVYWSKDWVQMGHIGFPLKHPNTVACDAISDRTREIMEGAVFPRGLTWLGAKCPFLCGFLTNVGLTIEKVAPFLFKI